MSNASPKQAGEKLSTRGKSRRRMLCVAAALPVALEFGAGPASAAPAPAASAASAPPLAALAPQRIALLLGNAVYPEPFDLPPVPKNVGDLRSALQRRGFVVLDALNLDLAAAKQVVAAFIDRAQHAGPDSVLFFYFSGHGAQVDAANLLLPAGVSPAASPDVLRDASLQLLRDVVDRMPPPNRGVVIAVVDACRTSLQSGPGPGGLNQVEAPPGCLVVFSTAAGKPAIAPAVATRDTFFTAALVKLLDRESDETSFSDLFQLVRTDVYNEMVHYPIPIIRQFAQDPFIADHSLVRVTLGVQTGGNAQGFGSAAEQQAWQHLQALSVPLQISTAATQFLADYPASKYAAAVRVELDGAQRASQLLQRNDIHLYVSDFVLHPQHDSAQWMRDVRRAARGDKDAAARLGLAALRDGAGDRERAMARYEGWMQFAAALGNGIASYQLSLYYRQQSQPMLAAQFESRARSLGYTPPPTLDNVRR